MLKLNGFILTVTLSLFTLILFKTEGPIVYKAATHTEAIKINGFHNTSAVATNNFSYEQLGSVKQKITSPNFIHSVNNLKKAFLDEGISYLKDSNFIDLNLTTRTIIYPFHSFL